MGAVGAEDERAKRAKQRGRFPQNSEGISGSESRRNFRGDESMLDPQVPGPRSQSSKAASFKNNSCTQLWYSEYINSDKVD